MIVEWDNHIATIKSKVSIVESAIMKKLENAGKIKESEKQFEKDYNELEAWLTEQENEMEVIRKVTVASPSDTSKLLDRCKVYIYMCTYFWNSIPGCLCKTSRKIFLTYHRRSFKDIRNFLRKIHDRFSKYLPILEVWSFEK